MRSHVQSCKLVHMSGVLCHVCASSTGGCAFVYFTVQYCVEHRSTVSLFQTQDSGSKCKTSGDVAGTTVLFKVLYCKIKNVFLFFVFLCFYVLFV